MAILVPLNEEKKNKAEETFSKTIFKTPEMFVDFYLEGVIARNVPLSRELIEELKESYKNIKTSGNTLIVLSERETELEETIAALEDWKTALHIKREVERAQEDGDLEESDLIAFSDKEIGYVCRVFQDEEGNVESEKVGEDKIFYAQSAITPIHDRFSSVGERTEHVAYFKQTDFTHLDDSFIERMYHELP